VLIEARQLVKSFGGRLVVSLDELDVRPGDLLAVVGPSGSGKSTLLGLLGGAIRPDSGSATIAGRPVDARTDVTWVPQGNNVLGPRSVIDNCVLGALAAGVAPGSLRPTAYEALDAVGLSSHASRQAFTLSGGELQRLAIARALAARRAFLMADEPTGNLDRASTANVVACLRVAARAGMGVVVATHDGFVMDSADRIHRVEAPS
jgi:putative ABC transport system ATP-binding protein/lipoprotein-releasing system ATP-binding protein